jgi:hypothetical protein
MNDSYLIKPQNCENHKALQVSLEVTPTIRKILTNLFTISDLNSQLVS